MARSVSNSSVAAEVDIICKRGDTFSRVFQFFTGSGDTEVDITDSDFNMEAYINKNLKPVLEFHIGDGFEITGVNEITAFKANTAMMIPEGTYRYDLQQTLNDGTVITRIKGNFIIEDDETA